MNKVDVVIIGASFSGVTMGHHLPRHFKTLILDKKPNLNSTIESTGLITQATHTMLDAFVDVNRFIPNKIDSIVVVDPSYQDYFESHTKEPWIYTTDTPELVKHMMETLPENVEVKLSSTFKTFEVEVGDYPVKVTYVQGGHVHVVHAKFIVGADGSHSKVAEQSHYLSQNKKFLAAYEKVFYGDITLGEHPETSVYHFWFGEFSLGYGGWLSPTIINGKKAFRLGLAKHKEDAKELKKIDAFIERLKEEGMIKIDPTSPELVDQFAHLIPMGGVLKRLTTHHAMLVGDAAGFCGAFAADGIKGAVLSGKVGANLLAKYLSGDKDALRNYKTKINAENRMLRYYKKQVFYRKIWDIMKSNRTFTQLYKLIKREKDGFLNQFCDSKDRHRSLTRVILKPKHLFPLLKYSFFMAIDLFKSRR